MTTTDPEIAQPYHPTHCPNCELATETDRPFCSRCGLDLRYGSPKRLAAGTCIYCGQHGKLSGEHIFPDWLSKQYPRRSQETLHHLHRPERHAFDEAVPTHAKTYTRKGDPYTTKVLNVCEPCNNDWMATLQNAAKPLVQRLAGGEWPSLLEAECDLLARWATMVSINIQCHARLPGTTEHQRATLMNGTMPSGWRISIGSMKTTDWAGCSHHRAVKVMMQIADGEHLPIHSTYFCIERVAFHTVSSFDDHLLHYGMIYGVGEVLLPTRALWPFDPLADQAIGRELIKDDLVGIQRHFGYKE